MFVSDKNDGKDGAGVALSHEETRRPGKRGIRLPSLKRLLKHGPPWSLISNFNRYWHCIYPHMTAGKLANFVHAHIDMARGSAKVHSTPYMLRIEPTNVCNLRCPGCATGLGINPRPKGFLDKKNFAAVLKQVAPHLLLTRMDGLGEPFLHPDICELIEMAHRAGSTTVASSHFGPNTLRPGMAADIVKSGLDHLIVSIDGPDQETYEKYRVGGNLALTMEHVRELVAVKKAMKSKKPLVEVQFIGFGHNRDSESRMPEIVRSIGADRLVCKLVREDVLRERKAEEGAGKRCFWLYTTWTIGWDGERKLCSNSIADKFDMPNAFHPDTDLMKDVPLLAAVREFLASRDRDFGTISPLLGDPKSKDVPWSAPRNPDMCRCLACAGVGLVIDRTKKWLDEYICM